MARIPQGLILLAALSACASTPQVEKDRSKAQLFFAEGDALYAKREFGKAFERYTAAIQLSAESPEPYYKRGRCRLKLIDANPEINPAQVRNEALQDFSQAIRLLPIYFEAYYARAVTYASQANYKGAAMDLLHHCLKLRPQDQDSTLLLARIYDEGYDDQQPRAMVYYEKYLKLGGTDEKARRRYDELKAAAAIAMPPPEDEKKASELYAKALVNKGIGQRDEALKNLRNLMEKYGQSQFVKGKTAEIEKLLKELDKK